MKTLLEIPHIVQYFDVENDFWQGRSCGIVSLAMIFEYYGVNVSLEDLIETGLRVDGYIDGVGWKHDAIVELAKGEGFESHRVEDDSIESLIESLNRSEPVIVSIYRDFDLENGGHLAVLNGYFENDGELIGFYVTDPVGASYKHKDQFIKIDKFMVGWKKRSIYIRKAKH